MSACSKQSRPTAPKGGSPFAPTNSPTVSDRTPLANSPDWLKAAPMWENLLASWRQSGQKKDYCPSLLNHNAKYKRLLPPCCDFANGIGRIVTADALNCQRTIAAKVVAQGGDYV